MIERDLLEGEPTSGNRWMVDHRVPVKRAGNERARPPRPQVRQGHHLFQAAERARDLPHLHRAVELLPAVAVPVHAEQHLRCELGEPVDHAAPAEIGGAAGPDGADAGGGQHRDDGLRDVRHDRHDPVAGANP